MIVRTARELAHLIRETRQRRALTQAQLAAVVGVSRKWIIDLEAGKRARDLSLVLRTLNALGLDVHVRERSPVRSAKGAAIDAIVDASRRTRG